MGVYNDYREPTGKAIFRLRQRPLSVDFFYKHIDTYRVEDKHFRSVSAIFRVTS